MKSFLGGEARRTSALAWLFTVSMGGTTRPPSRDHPPPRAPIGPHSAAGTHQGPFPLSMVFLWEAKLWSWPDRSRTSRSLGLHHLHPLPNLGAFMEDRLKSVSCQQKASHRHPLSAGSEEAWSPQWSPSPLGQHLSDVEDMPTGPQCSPGHGTRGSVWEMWPRAWLSRPLAEYLLVPHHAASHPNAFAPQADQKASSPLMAQFCVKRLPDYLTISCAH